MANAGVQMRQELYAVILGRQRATDQLAMMFKFVGINIQNVINEAKKEGKSIIEALAEALQPFEEVNKKLGEEYQTQINKLNIIWDRIKRIGAETTLNGMAEMVKRINDSLMTSTGDLTKLGRQFAYYLGNATESLRIIMEMLGNVAISIGGGTDSVKSMEMAFRGVMGGLLGISALADGIFSVFHAIAKLLAGLLATISLILEGEIKAAREVAKQTVKDVWDTVEASLKRTEKTFDAINDSANDLKNTLKESNTEALKLNAVLLSLPFSDFGALEKMTNKITKARKDALSGPAKIDFEYNEALKSVESIREGLTKNYNLITKKYNEYIASGKKLSKEEAEAYHNKLQAQIDGLSMIKDYENALNDERLKKLADWEEKQKDHFASLKYNIDSLMESLEIAPSNKMEVILKKYEKEQGKIEKLIKQSENEFPELLKRYKKEFSKMGIKTKEDLTKAIWEAFYKGQGDSINKTFEEQQKKIEEFLEKIKSHDTLNVFEQINNEMKKLHNEAVKLYKNDEEGLKLAEAKLEIYRLNRRAVAEINLELEKQKQIMETTASYARLLAESIRPKDKQRADLMNLEADYTNTVGKINGEIEKIDKTWKENGEWKKDVSQHVKDEYFALKVQLDNEKDLYEYHKKQVQEPFWNDLKDMAQGWGDSFADVLNEAAFNLDSFSDNFKKFTQDIARQASRAWIKRNITDNLLNMLPSFGPNTPILGGGEQTQKVPERTQYSFGVLKSDQNPAKDAEEKTQKTMFETIKTGWNGVSNVFKSGFDKFVNVTGQGFNLLKSGLGNLFNTIMDLIKAPFTQSYNGAGGTMGALSKIGGFLFGAFGGGGNGGGEVSASQFTSNGGSSGALNAMNVLGGAADVAMAGGGIINEPIIGRGLNSGKSYSFGEGGKPELVTPMNKVSSNGNNLSISIPVNVGDGGYSNAKISKLKSELERSTREIAERVLRENI
jgi:hypothetical protein